MIQPDKNTLFLSTLLQLEESARRMETVEGLHFSMANELRRAVNYRFAAVMSGDGASCKGRVAAVSGVAVLERDAPMVRWLDRMAARLAGQADAGTVHRVDPEPLTEADRAEWAEWCPPEVVWCPLMTGDGRRLGALWLARDKPWDRSELLVVERLAGCYAHAWLALTGGKGPQPAFTDRLRWPALAVTALATLGLAVPVSQSALAPVEIVATEPVVVAAPIDGVIARFQVAPNQPVTAGQPLFTFDDTTLRNQAAVAERTLGIAQAELHQAVQGAFGDRKQAGQMALLEAQVQLRAAELDFARSLLERVEVKAQRAGTAVFTDANDWIGRPVVIGQRILQIADPERVEARIALPVRDAIALKPAAPVDLFLDNDPLGRLSAKLATASFEADMTPAGVLAYRLTATLEPGGAPPRIGLQGTANVHGRSVPVLLYLFRRPLTALRQWLGV
ncbi:MAG: HlyD family efflux transporter periplasmic adaptor subunit [Rhodospirillaceae bacterium]